MLAFHLKNQMGKPTVGGGAVLVLHAGRNVDHRTGKHLLRRFSLFLIPSAPRNAD